MAELGRWLEASSSGIELAFAAIIAEAYTEFIGPGFDTIVAERPTKPSGPRWALELEFEFFLASSLQKLCSYNI